MDVNIRDLAPSYRTMPGGGGFMGAVDVNGDYASDIVRGALQRSVPIVTRGVDPNEIHGHQLRVQEIIRGMNADGALNRSDGGTDVAAFINQLAAANEYLLRNLSTNTPYMPIRENLEGEVAVLFPRDTPLRNMIPRRPGAGRASVWKSITSFGGGWSGVVSGVVQTGGGPGGIRAFFSETGAPAEHTTTWSEKSATYKLLGTFGSVTGLAAAQGMNFGQNQLIEEKTRAIQNLILNEEFAFVNGDSSSTAAPWGDGANALAFDGILNQITTAAGTPSAQVQSSVGALTTALIDGILRAMWEQGVHTPWMMLASQEVLSLVHLATTTGTIIRMQANTDDGGVLLGVKVVGYVHPVTGEIVKIIPSRFIPAGTMLFGTDRTPDGRPVVDVDVLPQVQLPELAPNMNVQGFVAQELAPDRSSPQVYSFIVTVYEVFRLKYNLYAAKATGVTAV